VAHTTRQNLGFLLAKASQRWNELLADRFRAAGYAEVRPAWGSVLVPLFEEDRLRIGELARRARLSKQTMTTLVRLVEREGLVRHDPDPTDARATLVSLTERGHAFRPVAEAALARLDRFARRALTAQDVEHLKQTLKGVIEL
jgi:DNA-binding MarR family transcriptional regulator